DYYCQVWDTSIDLSDVF
nr:immunoglobulin light chain junction region [Macaca mulatta]MOY06290.1 immunoglobulin light chain junction region [Macaca mulatta]MOY07656.1 immunoglobulin light chain junction region [Macaca mulatta]